MSYIIGSARIDERGKAYGGTSGDQKQTSTPDYKGEVSMQTFYVHSLGWRVLRPKSDSAAIKIAEGMTRACNNKHIGYNQYRRLEVISNGTGTSNNIACDCSSLVRQCIREAGLTDPGNFTTGNEASCILATGQFTDMGRYSSGMKLYTGDVLVTCSKGHTVIVTTGESRAQTTDTKTTTAANTASAQIAAAQSFSRSVAGTYKTTANLNMRTKPVNGSILVTAPKGQSVTCYGYYTKSGNTNWLLCVYNGKSGFMSADYLRR